jgi:hypothetical protein
MVSNFKNTELYSVLRIRALLLFYHWIRDRFFPHPEGSRIPEDLGSRKSGPGSATHISESLVTIFRVKSTIILLSIDSSFLYLIKNKIVFFL